jgi:hypothetical protein
MMGDFFWRSQLPSILGNSDLSNWGFEWFFELSSSSSSKTHVFAGTLSSKL